LATCDLNRNTPRTCTPEIDEDGNFQRAVVDSPELRDRMENLLLEILKHCAVLEELGTLEEDI